MKLAGFTYDATHDVVLVDLAGVRLETRADIDRHMVARIRSGEVKLPPAGA